MVDTPGKSFTLCVGIDTYSSAGIPPLNWAIADADSFYQACLRGRDLDLTEARLITGSDATTEALRSAFGEWLAEAAAEDNVVAYFAGHGARELPPGKDLRTATEAYLLPFDAKSDRLYSTAISLTHELPTLLSRIRAKNTALIFDCCLSGSARVAYEGQRTRGIDGPNLRRALALSDVPLQVAVGKPGGGVTDIGDGVSILMACGPSQAALESDSLRHGIFTYHLLEVLNGSSQARTDAAPLGLIYADVVSAVARATNARQVPMLEGRLSDQRLFTG